MSLRLTQVRRLATPAALQEHLGQLEVELEVDPAVQAGGPLETPRELGRAGVSPNRWAILPMEGWDGSADGRPTPLVHERWRRFGLSGAGLIWGGEAYAVVPDGRANPHQLCFGPETEADLVALRSSVLAGYRVATESDSAPVLGLQLTHSGRYSRPAGLPAPRIAYRHPVLDPRVGATDAHLCSDGELDDLLGAFVRAAVVARDAGFDFVDLKQCHGYLLHKLLSAHDRPGPYGGDLASRTRFIRTLVTEVRRAAPELGIGTRLSVFDAVPFVPGVDGVGIPDPLAELPYRYAFGGDGSIDGRDLAEPLQLLETLRELGVEMCCVTAGSPYTTPHRQRPAYFPPSDGYLPPRDPLAEVAALLQAATEVKSGNPALVVVASGLTYCQEWLPNVAQALVRTGGADLIGLGRMVLSYPTLPRDVASGRGLDRTQLCRTFSDCTTAPRHGLVSGCYPIDPAYKQRPERLELASIKRRMKGQTP